MEKPQPQHRFSLYFYNRITYAGIFLASFIFIIELILFGLDFFSAVSNIYLSLFTFVVLPPFLIVGLLLIPIGAVWKRRRVLSGQAEAEPRALHIDPTIPEHRNAIMVFTIGTVILVTMTVVGTYKAYQYSESVHFCGITCHEVMKPQYTAYAHSPHARVQCVECHIGPGADWYVRSKISGLRQVYKTFMKSYPRPIPTPVRNLRPAKETCEHCHWPQNFYSSFEVRRTYYPSDTSKSPPWILRMLIHIGKTEGQKEGIHSHMYIDNDVYYVASDEKRQKIPWVKSVGKDGKVSVYTTGDSPYKNKEPDPKLIRQMDCMDCHNRPSHHFEPPYVIINRAMSRGEINPEIPEIKAQAMKLLSQEYKTEAEGLAAITSGLPAFYEKSHADYFSQNKDKVMQATETLKNLFEENIFPEMKVRWDVYPDNIGHIHSPGCFRCHDGEHRSADGKVITNDCSVCHTIIEQGPAGNVQKSTEGLPFQHPFEDDGLWKDMKCFDCHTGGAM